MIDAELPIRTSTADDFDAVATLIARAFHEPLDAEVQDIERGIVDPARGLVTSDGDEIVGHVGAFAREMTVPGAVLPAAHVTMVSVAATHRRRGLLTRMMHRQLRDIQRSGREPFAVLWASEGRIYHRFGYGLASHRLVLDVRTQDVRLRRDWQQPGQVSGRLRAGEPTDLLKDMRTVYDQLLPSYPGWSSRDDNWWRYVLVDSEQSRQGAMPRRAAVVYGPDGPTGYVTWSAKEDWTEYGPCGHLRIREVVAADPASYTQLWDFLLGMDLIGYARFGFASVDEPLLHLVEEPRRLGARLADGLWVRLIDLAAALAGRRYAAPIDVVFEVTDPLLPENSGRWRLTGDQNGAACAPTSAPADLACDIRAISAAYLGGPSLIELAAVDRVRELRRGALLAASVAFRWDRAPGAIDIF